MATNLLTDLQIRKAQPKDKEYSLNDGGGLIVLVHPNSSKYFQLRATVDGKRKRVQLGKYGDMTLEDARESAKGKRRQVKDGIDPVQDKRSKVLQRKRDALMTFKGVADEWMAIKQRTVAASSYRKIHGGFTANVYPKLGSLPIKQVDALMVREVMQVMEKRGATELMTKCRQWVKNVFEYALGEGLIDRNPIPAEDVVLAKHKSERFPTFRSRKDAGQFLRNLQEYPGKDETRLAIWLQLLVATRPGELRLAEWGEFDLDKALWTVPMDRMKSRMHMTEPYIVTLSKQAVDVLRELHEYTGHSKFLFPGNDPTKPISDMTIAKALRAVWKDYRVVPHGFRHFFSTEANEHGQFRPDVIEAALAHKDTNAIRAVYNRATYINDRRDLSQWWADELEAMRDGAKVVAGKFGAR